MKLIKNKEEKGITLVALIITIIILIILAAITIVQVVKMNIVEIATKASQNYLKEEYTEMDEFEELSKRVSNKDNIIKFYLLAGERLYEYSVTKGTSWEKFIRESGLLDNSLVPEQQGVSLFYTNVDGTIATIDEEFVNRVGIPNALGAIAVASGGPVYKEKGVDVFEVLLEDFVKPGDIIEEGTIYDVTR